MKKILLITLLLIPFIGFSQTLKPIDAFLGIKFGSSKLAVINTIKAKGGIIDKQNTDAEQIAFSNVKLGDRESVGLAVRFIHNKAYFAIFVFKADAEAQTVDYYNDLVKEITGVYGDGQATKEFKSGFKDGDGHEVIAIQNGYADFHTNWFSNKNSIRVAIDNELFISLSYMDAALNSEAEAAQAQKNKSVY